MCCTSVTGRRKSYRTIKSVLEDGGVEEGEWETGVLTDRGDKAGKKMRTVYFTSDRLQRRITLPLHYLQAFPYRPFLCVSSASALFSKKPCSLSFYQFIEFRTPLPQTYSALQRTRSVPRASGHVTSHDINTQVFAAC
jgi:hypothetical protein